MFDLLEKRAKMDGYMSMVAGMLLEDDESELDDAFERMLF